RRMAPPPLRPNTPSASRPERRYWRQRTVMLGLIEPKGRAMTSTVEPVAESRHTRLDVCGLEQPATLIFNPNSGQKLGMSTNSGGAEEVQASLRDARIPFDPWPTERAGHATELARKAVAEGRPLVIAAGGD